jgi:DNA-directed DNA polymerase III PolC
LKAYLWIDCETTGLDAQKNDIVQIACIPIINGVRHDSFNEFCQPLNYAAVDAEAVAVHGITVERMRTFQPQEQMIRKFESFLRKHNTKFVIAGFNVGFDKHFLSATFAKLGVASLYREFFEGEIHDTMLRAKLAKGLSKNPKLSKLAEEYGIEINAHEALSDIDATIAVDKVISGMLGDEDIILEPNSVVEEDLPHPAYLHLHSEYSISDSVSTFDDWVRWAITNNVKTLSFPDHNLASSLFKATNVKATIDKINKEDKTKHAADAVQVVPSISINIKDPKLKQPYFRLNVWAVSMEGYRTLLKLASMGWEPSNIFMDEGFKTPVIPLEDFLETPRSGVVYGTACDKGILGAALDSFDTQEASYEYVKETIAKIAESFVFELLPFDIVKVFNKGAGFLSHKRTANVPDGNVAVSINKLALQLALDLEMPYIVSTCANFIDKDDHILQQIVSKSSFKDGRSFYESRHQRSPGECHSTLSRHLGSYWTKKSYLKAVDYSHDLAIAGASIGNVKYEYHLPRIEVPADIAAKSPDDYDKQLYYLLMAKIKEHGRWSDDPVYVARFKKEIDVIWKNSKLNFLPYFLVYEDISSFARSKGILQNIARGSAGGCLISYYLKIIHINPIAENLPFERFLSHARINAGSFPDIDSDFGERGDILSYLKEKYGAGFAQIGTFQKFKTKNAIKEVMAALYHRGRNDRRLMDVCDTIADSPQGLDEYDFLYGYVDSEDVAHKGHLEQNEVLQAFFKQHDGVESVVRRLLGLPNTLGRHASGFVISTLNINGERIPTLLVDDKDVGLIPVTQFDAPMVEKCSLVKADILGLLTIKTVADCVALIKERTGEDLLDEDENGVQYLYRLPEDPRVYEDFYRKRTDSSFQFNTNLIKGYVTDFAPIRRKDLADLTALCRPGALDAPLEDTTAAQYYMDVKNGRRELTFLHPDLEPILKDDFGVFVYQESVMRFLVEIAGMTWEKADTIRSAIAKKKRDVIMATFDEIRKACIPRGWTPEAVETICQQILAFSSYSFNLSHSRAYAELGYITMWLKRNYPLEWWSSELNNSNEKKMRHYVSLLGKAITPPTLNAPSNRFTIVGKKIASPLGAIKGFGPPSINAIVDAGPYANLQEFVDKTSGSKVNMGHVMALMRARALDCFMDPNIPYGDARLKLINEYCKIRKIKKSKLSPTMLDASPLNIFFQERDTSMTFNRTLASDPELMDGVRSVWPFLLPYRQGGTDLPFITKPAEITDYKTGKKKMTEPTPIMASVPAAGRLIANNEAGFAAGFIGFFQSSSHKSGTSKKSGREWNKVEVMVSDGQSSIECLMWDAKKALRLPVNSIVLVRGFVKKGWKGDPQITIDEIEPISDWTKDSKLTVVGS